MTSRQGGEHARYWRHPAVPGVDLMHASYRRHAFVPHTHDTFAIGVVYRGVEELRIGGTTERVGAGGTVLLDPEVVHTGRAASAGGWAYRVLYPAVGSVTAALSELGGRGTPSLAVPVVTDPGVAAAVLAAHRAAESADRLAACSLLHEMFGLLWRRHGRLAPRGAGHRVAERARELLLDRMADPPGLAELAAELGTGRFALLRAFRARFGLPPHAYLNQQRVRRARTLLARGEAPAAVAGSVGFVDQSHLTRHFRRTVGVPPGAYRRATTYKIRQAGPA